MKIKEFIHKYNKLYIPYLSRFYKVSNEEVTETICNMWDSFKNPQMVNNLLVKNNDNKCEYYERCDTKYQRGKHIHHSKLENFYLYNNSNDQHISVFRHDKSWVSNARATGSVSCRNTSVSSDWIYIELDRSEGYQKALKDAIAIYDKFPHKDRMFLWFSGNNSVHVAVHASLFGYPMGQQENVCGLGRLYYNLAHKIAGDVRHNNGLVDSWLADENEIYEKYYETFGEAKNNGDISEMKQDLENVDPNLFRVNSLIRQPWSRHEKTGNMKVLLDPETGKEEKEKRKLDIKDKKPYLITWVNECYEPRYKRKPYNDYQNYESTAITKVYESVRGFDLSDEHNGWVQNCYSPFYNDTNPSVAININTGWYTDHGEPTHSFNLVEFYSKLKDIEYEEAKKVIENL